MCPSQGVASTSPSPMDVVAGSQSRRYATGSWRRRCVCGSSPTLSRGLRRPVTGFVQDGQRIRPLATLWRVCTKDEWIVEIDIQSFFDTASHERLLAAVAEVVADGRILRLVQAFLQAGVMEEGKRRTLVAGTPQGGVLSPLLSNAFLNTFDHQLLAAGHRAVRYADDSVVVCRTREDAEAALEQVRQILEGQLGLRLHPQKTRVVHITEGFEFLGFRFWRDDRGLHLQPRARAVQRVKEKIRHLTRRLRPLRVDRIVAQLNPVITGWGRFFRIGELRCVGRRLDRWILRRLRAFLAKRWRTANWRRYPDAFFYRRLGLRSLREFS